MKRRTARSRGAGGDRRARADAASLAESVETHQQYTSGLIEDLRRTLSDLRERYQVVVEERNELLKTLARVNATLDKTTLAAEQQRQLMLAEAREAKRTTASLSQENEGLVRHTRQLEQQLTSERERRRQAESELDSLAEYTEQLTAMADMMRAHLEALREEL